MISDRSKIIPATKQIIQEWYGDYPLTIEAKTVELPEGRAIFGLIRQPGFYVAFYDTTLDVTTHKKLLITCYRILRDMMKTKTIPIYAQRSDETKESFMRHFNFKPVTDELYRWQG